MRAIFASFLLTFNLLLIPQILHADDFRDGVRAYNKKNFSEALSLWLPLAEQGNPLVQTLVGSMYAYGEGTEQDDTKAVKWFTRAAKNGSAQAQYNLGIMYEQGFGVEKDLNKARRWLLAAAKQGREEARKRLDTLSASPVVEQPATPAPGTDIKTTADPLPDSTEITKSSNTQPATVVSTTIMEQQPAPTPEPDTKTTADTLPGSPEITKSLDAQSASVKSDTVAEQTATPAPGPDIETEEDEFASPPPLTITFDSLFASIAVEQEPAAIETDGDELDNPAVITIDFETLFGIQAAPTAAVEQTQSPAPATMPVPVSTPAPLADTKTPTDELLGPPGIDVTSSTDASLDWLREQPANYYTIQLVASIEQRLIDDHMKDIQRTDNLAQIMSKRNGQTWHAIVYGSFETFNEAKLALDALPKELRSWKPWIRPFSSIKQFKQN